MEKRGYVSRKCIVNHIKCILSGRKNRLSLKQYVLLIISSGFSRSQVSAPRWAKSFYFNNILLSCFETPILWKTKLCEPLMKDFRHSSNVNLQQLLISWKVTSFIFLTCFLHLSITFGKLNDLLWLLTHGNFWTVKWKFSDCNFQWR